MQKTSLFTESKHNSGSLTSVENVDILTASTKSCNSGTMIANNEMSYGQDKVDVDRSADFLKNTFYTALAPLITCLKLSGLYFVRPTGKAISFQQVYCCVIGLFPFANLASEMAMFRYVSSLDVNSIIHST